MKKIGRIKHFLDRNQYLPHSYSIFSDKGFKSTVLNRTCHTFFLTEGQLNYVYSPFKQDNYGLLRVPVYVDPILHSGNHLLVELTNCS